jgi:hypothetical protein
MMHNLVLPRGMADCFAYMRLKQGKQKSITCAIGKVWSINSRS